MSNSTSVLTKQQIVWVQHLSHNENDMESKLYWPGIVDKVDKMNKEMIYIRVFGWGQKPLVFHRSLVLGDWNNTEQQDIIYMHFNVYGRLHEKTWKKWSKSVKRAMEEEQRRKDLMRINKQREIERKEREKECAEEQDRKDKLSGITYDGREKVDDELVGFILYAGDTIQYYPEALMIGNANKNITDDIKDKDNNYLTGITTQIIQIGDLYEIQKLTDVGPIEVENWMTPPFMDTDILLLKSEHYTKDELDYIKTNNIYYALGKCKLEISKIESSIKRKREEEYHKFRKKMEKNGWGSMLYSDKNITKTLESNNDESSK